MAIGRIREITFDDGVVVAGNEILGTGPTGEQGVAGNTILSGTSAPTTQGVDGDYYLDSVALVLYGPKATTWPSGTNLIVSDTTINSGNADVTMTSSSSRSQVITATSANRTITLPTTGVSAGTKYRIMHHISTKGKTYVVYVKSSGGGALVRLFNGDILDATALVNTPTKPSDYSYSITRKKFIGSPSKWSYNLSGVNRSFLDICWSAELGLFCAVSYDANIVMTSPDGVNWSSRTTDVYGTWATICWSAELNLFCAISLTTGAISTSSNGINWTTISAPANINWRKICWSAELGLFCAVGSTGATYRVMTSPNGTDWTLQVSDITTEWYGVCWSAELGLFCAVGKPAYGTNIPVMTSPDGVSWTTRTATTTNTFNSVCWSAELGLFCAVARDSNDSNRIMTSPDGYVWTFYTTAQYYWWSVCWCKELGMFLALSQGKTTITSIDGITWTKRDTAFYDNWRSVAYSPELGLFCSVAETSSNNKTMICG